MINKLSSSKENLLANLWLVAYLHKIEVSYSVFATAYGSSARIIILELLIIIAELEDESK